MDAPNSRSVVPAYLNDKRFRHVPGILDREPSWIMRKLLPLLAREVQIDERALSLLRSLAAQGPLVYALKYRSVIDLQLARMRLAELGLPVPAFAFDLSPLETGSLARFYNFASYKLSGLSTFLTRGVDVQPALHEIFSQGGAPLFFLVDERTTLDRYVRPEEDPIRILLDSQSGMSASMAIVPIFILHDRTPRAHMKTVWDGILGDADRPGLLKRLHLATRRWTTPELLVGDPVYLVGEFEEFGGGSWEETPFEIRKRLLEAINVRVRVNRGPELPSRTEIKEMVLQDRRVQEAVQIGEAGGEEENRKKAEHYIEEIAGNPQFHMFHFLFYFVKWAFGKIFDGIDYKPSDFSKLKAVNTKYTLVHVSSHKSHADYLLVGYLSFLNQLMIPLMAAGKNLLFWPLGPVMRHGAAFFIRRSIKGLPLYTEVFAAYVRTLVQEKVNINFYIEGGRSRTGKLMPPRTGMLGFVLEAIEGGAVEDLAFIPTYSGYDQIPEEKSYLSELAGREKEKESIVTFFQAKEVLKRRFGGVYVRFDDHITLGDYCRKAGMDFKEFFGPDKRKNVVDFANYLMYGIVRVSVAGPIDITSASLLCVGSRRIEFSRLMRQFNLLRRLLAHKGFEVVTALQDDESGISRALAALTNRRLISEEQTESGRVFELDRNKRSSLAFYKNMLVNFVWPESLICIALRRKEETRPEKLRDDFLKLRGLLGREIIHDPLVSDDRLFTEGLENLAAMDAIILDAAGAVQVKAEELVTGLSLVTADILSAYAAVMYYLESERGETGPKEITKYLLKQQRENESHTYADALVSTVSVGNALEYLADLGFITTDERRKVQKTLNIDGIRALRLYMAELGIPSPIRS